MEIIIDSHTLKRAQERGVTEEEINEVIETGFSIPAK
jgi:AhpD family alkylhydroperoxidase